MALSEIQLQHYYREGYVVVPGLVPEASIAGVMAAAPKEAQDGGGWRATIYKHADPLADGAIHALLAEPAVIDAVEAIFGAPARVYYGMLAVVPANGGHGLPWHQDNQYQQVLGGALNTFIALSDITPDKAILWVAPRSHWLGTQPSKTNETTARGHREAIVEPENGIALPAMQIGDVCIFDRNTYHRSLRNETDSHRFAYAAQYCSFNARRAPTGRQDPHWILARDLQRLWADADALQEEQMAAADRNGNNAP